MIRLQTSLVNFSPVVHGQSKWAFRRASSKFETFVSLLRASSPPPRLSGACIEPEEKQKSLVLKLQEALKNLGRKKKKNIGNLETKFRQLHVFTCSYTCNFVLPISIREEA